MVNFTCQVCQEQAAKYCCPACQMRTCSLACVQAHKKESKCPGLKVAPTAPAAADKYGEEDFVKDYQFLERVNSYTASTQQQPDGKKRDKRALLARKIQQVAKLAEFNLLPETFSRAKANQTRIVRVSKAAKEGESSEEPESSLSRSQQMIWTVGLVRKSPAESQTQTQAQTIHGVSDSDPLSALLADLSVERIFLRLEGKKQRSDQKLLEIPRERWNESLYSVLQGSSLIEYPVFVYE